ncbi:MAG: CDGSH iron-sulfur domain-containing protein [Acidobacteriota bacterium]
MADPLIKVIPNGPYRVMGPIKVTDAQGKEIVVEDGRGISLCRCGSSDNKPFCDGTHGRVGFQCDKAAGLP